MLANGSGTGYVQINLDPVLPLLGLPVPVTPSPVLPYDPGTRKITFTKDATYTTASDVSGAISAAVGDLGNDEDDAPYTTVKGLR